MIFSLNPDQRSWMRTFAENVMPPTVYKRLDEASCGHKKDFAELEADTEHYKSCFVKISPC